jgi:hypothetical protein
LYFSIRSIFAGDINDITSPDYRIPLWKIDPVRNDGDVPSGAEAATSLLMKIADLLLFAMPLIAAISLIIAWYYYILSSGDSEKANKAKTIIKWNIVAILVASFSYAIVKLLSLLLEGTL